jgi:hypothetical protein
VETDTADRLRRALLEHGFREAAALVAATLRRRRLRRPSALDDDTARTSPTSRVLSPRRRRDTFLDSEREARRRWSDSLLAGASGLR